MGIELGSIRVILLLDVPSFCTRMSQNDLFHYYEEMFVPFQMVSKSSSLVYTQ